MNGAKVTQHPYVLGPGDKTMLNNPPPQVAAVDRAGRLWVSMRAPLKGGIIWRLDHGDWTVMSPSHMPGSKVYTMLGDRDGSVWMGYADDVAKVEGDRVVRNYGLAEGLDVGGVAVISHRREILLVGGERGLAARVGARFVALRTTDPHALNGTSGVVETSSGELWINATSGILHIGASEFRLALADPVYRMRFERFDELDGLPGPPEQVLTQPTAMEADDGVIWFVQTVGIVSIDPHDIVRNTVPPMVVIQ